MDKQGLTRFNTAWALFQGLLIEALPFLLIGVLISALARWLAPGGRWLRRLPAHPLLGPLSGAALGFALPACECGNVPVARRMLVGGAPLGTALGFLFAAPVLNPIVIASTWAAFPAQPWLLFARPIGAVLVALALSLLLRLIPEERLLQADVLAERQLNQPLSAVNLLQRRSGLVGIAATTATDQQESRQPLSAPSGSDRGGGFHPAAAHHLPQVQDQRPGLQAAAIAAFLGAAVPAKWAGAVPVWPQPNPRGVSHLYLHRRPGAAHPRPGASPAERL